MGNSWVREFRDGTAQTPGSVTPQQDSKVGSVQSFSQICMFLQLNIYSQPSTRCLVSPKVECPES